MKKIILTLLLLSILVLPSFASAYQVKFYSSSIKQSECLKLVEFLPQNYTLSIKAFRFYNKYFQQNDNEIYGRYYPGGVIDIFVSCDTNLAKETLLHELAHHQEYLNHRKMFDMFAHDNIFWGYYNQILKDSEEFINETH